MLPFLEGHRKIAVTKTNGRKNCFFNECVAENYERVTHERVTRYAECASNSCKRAANSNGNSKEGCPRKYKIEFCTNSNITKYFMQGEHLVPDRLYFLSPTKYKVSRYTEEFMKGMIENGFQPKTIFSKIVNNPAITDKPTLNFVQLFVPRARADGNDELKEVRDT